MLTHFIKFSKSVVLTGLILSFSLSVLSQKTQSSSSISSSSKSSTATLVKNKTFSLPEHFFGYNAQMLRGPAWEEPDFISQVKILQPQLIRYPGGTVASYWDWKSGWLMDGLDLKFDWANIPKNPLALENLYFACQQTGAKPLFVLNMINSTLENQLELLKHAKKIGLPIEFIELDNEVYLGDDFYVNRFPTGIDYAKESNIWISAIKKEFPGVKICVVGHSARVGAGNSKKKNFVRTEIWNRDVLSEIENADAMSFHVYGGNGLGFTAKKLVSDVEDDKKDNPEKLQSIFDQNTSIPVILGIPFQRWKNSNAYDYQLLPDNMKVWASEYNMFEREGVVAGTWVHGLYAVTQTLLYFENQKTELACFHNLTTSAQFAAIFNNNNGFGKAVRKKENKEFDFTAAGYTLTLYSKLISNGGEAVKIKFSENGQLSGLNGQRYPELYGWMVESKKGKKALVLNLSDKAIMMDFQVLNIQNSEYNQIASKPQEQIASANDLIVQTGKENRFLLLPYSATIIEGE